MSRKVRILCRGLLLSICACDKVPKTRKITSDLNMTLNLS